MIEHYAAIDLHTSAIDFRLLICIGADCEPSDVSALSQWRRWPVSLMKSLASIIIDHVNSSRMKIYGWEVPLFGRSIRNDLHPQLVYI